MPIEEEPIVGAVYENEDGRSFEVTAFDEDDGTIKFQYPDGAVEEADIDAWYEMELKRIASPEDLEDADEDDELEEEDDEDEDEDDEDFDDDDEE